MRCKKCGAEIGEERVCPFCDTPIKNVLVAERTDKEMGKNKEAEAALLPQDSSEIFNSDETTVLDLDRIDDLKEQSKESFESVEDKKSSNTTEAIEEVSHDSEKEPSMIRTSVIPDYKIKERKRWSKKRKILTLVSAFFIVLLSISLATGVYIFMKYKNYIKGLKGANICFVDTYTTSLDAYYYIDKKDDLVYVFSSGRRYEAYQVNGSYTYTEAGYKPSENKIITMYTFDLYLKKEDQEIIRIYHEEKTDGAIEIIGVTDKGEIIYNDTEKDKCMLVSTAGSPYELGKSIKEGLFFEEGKKLILQSDRQLIFSSRKSDSGEFIVASNVTDFYFIYGDEDGGYIRSVDENITSTDSENLFIIYKNNKDEYFLKDLRSDLADSVKIDKNSINIDSLTIYEISDKDNVSNENTDGKKLEIKEEDISNKDLSGDGELDITDKGLVYKLKFYHRNLGSVDKVLALDGRYVYVIKNGKTARIDVFTKKEKVLFDKEMQIKRYY